MSALSRTWVCDRYIAPLRRPFTCTGHAHGSSFLLQVLLHLNAYYIAFWFVLLFFILVWKGLL